LCFFQWILSLIHYEKDAVCAQPHRHQQVLDAGLPGKDQLLVTVLLMTREQNLIRVACLGRFESWLGPVHATNFVELKGQVYKRTDTNKLWTLACQVGTKFLSQ
jgi:hypothetical protein